MEFHAFDAVTVRLSLDSTNVQHEKLIFQLVKPYIKGFSVELNENIQENESSLADPPPQKRVKKLKKRNKRKRENSTQDVINNSMDTCI